MSKQTQSSAAQYRPRILCRGLNNGTGPSVVAGVNNIGDSTNANGIGMIISPEDLQIEYPIMNMELQPESILLNSLLAPAEINNGVGITDAGLSQAIPENAEVVYVKLDEGQISNPADGAQNIIITLNETQLGGLAGDQTVVQASGESITPAASVATSGPAPMDPVQIQQKDEEEKKQVETGGVQSPPQNEATEEEKQEILSVMTGLLKKVEADLTKQHKPPRIRKKPSSIIYDRKLIKSEAVAPQEPLVWRDDLAFLPGTEFSFHVNESGNLVLHCPVIPVQAKMDVAVRMLNLKRNENHVVDNGLVIQEDVPEVGKLTQAAMRKLNSKCARKTGLTDNSNKISPGSNHENDLSPKSIQVNAKKKAKVSMASNPRRSPELMGSPSTNGDHRIDKPSQPRLTEAVKPDSTHEFVKPKPVGERQENKGRHSDPSRKAPRTNAPHANPGNPKPRQSEPASTSKADGPVKSGKTPKAKPIQATVKTTLCFNCAMLGEVATFIDGVFCSQICKDTANMLAEEETRKQRKQLNRQEKKNTGKKKATKKESLESSTSAIVSSSADAILEPGPAPVFYAKKTTIDPIELQTGQKIVPQFLPQPRLDVNLHEFMYAGQSQNPGTHEQNVVELRIEDRVSGPEARSADEDEEKANPTSGQKPPPRKHKKRASLTMRKRSTTQASNQRRSSREGLGRLEPKRAQNPQQDKKTAEYLHQVPTTFDWVAYLAETNSKAAPSRLFKQPVMPLVNGFKVGMVLEAIDPVHQSLFCVVHVMEVLGFRIRLRFTGYAEVYDFWVNADSTEIFPCGWCEDHGQQLLGPPARNGKQSQDVKSKPFNWHQFIVEEDATPAPRECFAIVREDVPFENTSEIQIGMKLEAVDMLNINYICVATVGNVIGDRFLVHFDSWDSLFDYWTDLTSAFIHPVGWCETNGRFLVPPQWGDERDAEKFIWADYLKETNSVPLPAKLFRPLPPVSFRKGMKVECVDKRTPSLIRVATIADVASHFITIHFDGWDPKYDYPVYELSPDIHPIGWCEQTRHPLQPPPSPSTSTSSKKKCPVFGCLGVGNIDGPKFQTHDSEPNCPYSDANYSTDFMLGDRLVSLDPVRPEPQRVVPEKPAARRKSGSRRSSNASKTKSQPRQSGKRSSAASDKRERKPPQRVSQRGKRASLDQESATEPEQTAADVTTPVPPRKKARKSVTEQESDLSVPEPTPTEPKPNTEVQTPAAAPDEEEKPTSKKSRKTPTTARKPARNRREKKSAANAEAEKPVIVTGQDQDDKLPESIAQVPPVQNPPSTSAAALAGLAPPQITLGQTAPAELPGKELPPNFGAHIQGLHKLVAGMTPSIVSKWNVQEVADFVVHVGCSPGVSQRLIIEHKLDGESFLLLTQHDILSYGFPYGPAMKIANAINIINASE